jgi:hypothetical protein
MKVNNTTLTADGSTSPIAMLGGFTTLPQQLLQTLAYAVECVYNGTTIAGDVKIQASLTYDPSTHNAGTWVDVTGSDQTLTAAGAGILNVGSAIPAYNWMRVVFTDTGSSSDAFMAVTVNVKGF